MRYNTDPYAEEYKRMLHQQEWNKYQYQLTMSNAAAITYPITGGPLSTSPVCDNYNNQKLLLLEDV